MRDDPAFANATISGHARSEMTRRGISEETVREVLRGPGRVETARLGRVILTSLRYDESRGRDYVVRLVVDVGVDPPVVVTAYRSSKLRKYWSST